MVVVVIVVAEVVNVVVNVVVVGSRSGNSCGCYSYRSYLSKRSNSW